MTQHEILNINENKCLLMIKEAVLKEREACAMECIKKANEWTRLGAWGSKNEFHECANAIRARGGETT
jgi:hypothetical protein